MHEPLPQAQGHLYSSLSNRCPLFDARPPLAGVPAPSVHLQQEAGDAQQHPGAQSREDGQQVLYLHAYPTFSCRTCLRVLPVEGCKQQLL